MSSEEQSARVIWCTVGVCVCIQGFPTEHYTVVRGSVLFTLTVISVINVASDTFFFLETTGQLVKRTINPFLLYLLTREAEKS